jgi:hypothetical protein
MMPAIVALYTYSLVRYGPSLQRKLAGFFNVREKLPKVVRLLITIGVPTAVSLLITNQRRVSDTAQKEQLVVLLGLVLAYLMLSPRNVDVAGGGR